MNFISMSRRNHLFLSPKSFSPFVLGSEDIETLRDPPSPSMRRYGRSGYGRDVGDNNNNDGILMRDRQNATRNSFPRRNSSQFLDTYPVHYPHRASPYSPRGSADRWNAPSDPGVLSAFRVVIREISHRNSQSTLSHGQSRSREGDRKNGLLPH